MQQGRTVRSFPSEEEGETTEAAETTWGRLTATPIPCTAGRDEIGIWEHI